MGVPYVRTADLQVERDALASVSERNARRFLIMPISIKDNVLNVAMADPSNVVMKDEIEKIDERIAFVNSAARLCAQDNRIGLYAGLGKHAGQKEIYIAGITRFLFDESG